MEKFTVVKLERNLYLLETEALKLRLVEQAASAGVKEDITIDNGALFFMKLEKFYAATFDR